MPWPDIAPEPEEVFRELVKRSGMKTARAFYRSAALVGVRVDGSGNFRLRPCRRDGRGFLGTTDDQVYELSDPDSTTLGERPLQALDDSERLQHDRFFLTGLQVDDRNART
jgi:hypothetical protein